MVEKKLVIDLLVVKKAYKQNEKGTDRILSI